MFKWLMLGIYLILCGYVLWGFCRWTEQMKIKYRKKIDLLVGCIFAVCASSIFLGKFLPESGIQRWILRFGNYWLGYLIYLIFFLAVIDLVLIVWLIGSGKKKKEQSEIENEVQVAEQLYKNRMVYGVLAAVVVLGSTGFSVYGSIHAKQIKTAEYELEVEKDAGDLKELNLILIADLHLGYSVGCPEMEKMVKTINAQNPDLVVLAGDIFDNSYEALDDPEGLAEIIRGIQTRYGVFAVYGNHDVEETLVAGFSVEPSKDARRDERMDAFMKNSGIQVLEDQTVLVDDSFYLTGRLDGEKNGYGSSKRASLESLLQSVDLKKPVFVINHEPDELEEYAAEGVDVLLSGHTHAGQFFPLTIVQPFVWENHWGMKKVDSMYSLVTSGVGVYGPDLRVGTDSEIMSVKVRFI